MVLTFSIKEVHHLIQIFLISYKINLILSWYSLASFLSVEAKYIGIDKIIELVSSFTTFDIKLLLIETESSLWCSTICPISSKSILFCRYSPISNEGVLQEIFTSIFYESIKANWYTIFFHSSKFLSQGFSLLHSIEPDDYKYSSAMCWTNPWNLLNSFVMYFISHSFFMFWVSMRWTSSAYGYQNENYWLNLISFCNFLLKCKKCLKKVETVFDNSSTKIS